MAHHNFCNWLSTESILGVFLDFKECRRDVTSNRNIPDMLTKESRQKFSPHYSCWRSSFQSCYKIFWQTIVLKNCVKHRTLTTDISYFQLFFKLGYYWLLVGGYCRERGVFFFLVVRAEMMGTFSTSWPCSWSAIPHVLIRNRLYKYEWRK